MLIMYFRISMDILKGLSINKNKNNMLVAFVNLQDQANVQACRKTYDKLCFETASDSKVIHNC